MHYAHAPRTRKQWFAIGDDDVVVNFVGPALPSRFARLGAAGWWLGKPFVVLSLGFAQSGWELLARSPNSKREFPVRQSSRRVRPVLWSCPIKFCV